MNHTDVISIIIVHMQHRIIISESIVESTALHMIWYRQNNSIRVNNVIMIKMMLVNDNFFLVSDSGLSVLCVSLDITRSNIKYDDLLRIKNRNIELLSN